MDIEKSFFESKVKKVARVTTKQHARNTTGGLINDSASSTTKRRRSTGTGIESESRKKLGPRNTSTLVPNSGRSCEHSVQEKSFLPMQAKKES